jgi:hypothetical protein
MACSFSGDGRLTLAALFFCVEHEQIARNVQQSVVIVMIRSRFIFFISMADKSLSLSQTIRLQTIRLYPMYELSS